MLFAAFLVFQSCGIGASYAMDPIPVVWDLIQLLGFLKPRFELLTQSDQLVQEFDCLICGCFHLFISPSALAISMRTISLSEIDPSIQLPTRDIFRAPT